TYYSAGPVRAARPTAAPPCVGAGGGAAARRGGRAVVAVRLAGRTGVAAGGAPAVRVGLAAAAVAAVRAGAGAPAYARAGGLADRGRRAFRRHHGDARPARCARRQGDVLRGRRTRRRATGAGARDRASRPRAGQPQHQPSVGVVLGAGAAADGGRDRQCAALAAGRQRGVAALVPGGGRHGQSVRGGVAEAARAGAGGVERARLRRGGWRPGAGGGADRARPRARRDRVAARERGAWAQRRDPAGPAGADRCARLSDRVARGPVAASLLQPGGDDAPVVEGGVAVERGELGGEAGGFEAGAEGVGVGV